MNNKDGWISVTEKLPQDGDKVIGITEPKNNHYYVKFIDGQFIFYEPRWKAFGSQDFLKPARVLYWRYM